MSKRDLHKLLLFIISTVSSLASISQSGYDYKASLGEVEAENFYKIILPPKVIAKCQPGLADIRIKDEKGDQVPYIIKTDLPVFDETNFVEFPIIASRKEADKQTHVIIKNVASREINNLLLFVKNAEARRAFNLSGSDDQHQWFVIKENIFLDNSFSDKGSFVQTLSFPETNYKYFQITIIGKNVLPVNIIKAGIYNKSFTEGKYIALPAPTIKQKDSTDKHSYVSLSFDDNYQIDQLELLISGVKRFRRTIKIYPSAPSAKDAVWYVLNSGSPSLLPVQFHASELIAEIYNEDNPPLKADGAKAWQLNQYLLAYLEKGEKYTVFFGDSTNSPPKYDLEFFKDSIGKGVSEISVGKIERASQNPVVLKKPPSVFDTIVLWIVIAVVLIILLTLTLRMTKEVNKRSNIE